MKHQKQIKKIAVFTSGGDAPGMNAAIRAVVRTAVSKNLEVYGVLSGYVGMIENKVKPLAPRDMANIIQRGGTVLKTGRSAEFMRPEFRKMAFDNMRSHDIDGLICIGGDGSFRGAHALWLEHQMPVIGVPGTIDNDIYGTEVTIGFDTAVNTALSAIDKIRDTADSHDRIFIVEVMGRNSGFIASHVGLAGGAEEIFTPEFNFDMNRVIEKLKLSKQKGKTSSIVVTAEGHKPGRAYDLADAIRKKLGWDSKVCILGHQQRGGSPTANDRILASRLGSASVELLLQGSCDIMVGVQGGKCVEVSFEDTDKKEKKLTDGELLKLSNQLAI